MYLKDSEPYRYGLVNRLEDVLAVGWLSKANPFPRGDSLPEFVRALEKMLMSNRVNQMKGHHVCEFCGQPPTSYEFAFGSRVTLGFAEIWVPSPDGNVIYAAPDLICHYVVEHRYLPPTDFISSVLRGPDKRGWDAKNECEMRLKAAYK